MKVVGMGRVEVRGQGVVEYPPLSGLAQRALQQPSPFGGRLQTTQPTRPCADRGAKIPFDAQPGSIGAFERAEVDRQGAGVARERLCRTTVWTEHGEVKQLHEAVPGEHLAKVIQREG